MAAMPSVTLNNGVTIPQRSRCFSPRGGPPVSLIVPTDLPGPVFTSRQLLASR